jgi:hypothetical protein
VTSSPPRRSLLALVYDLILGAAAGFSVGFFAWIASDRIGDDGSPAFWPFAVAGVLGMILLVRWARSRRGGGRWVNVLWIPVLVFVVLISMVVLALRNWN